MIFSINLPLANLVLDIAGVLCVAISLTGMITMIVKKYSFSSRFALNFALVTIIVGTFFALTGLYGVMAKGSDHISSLGLTLLLLGNGLVAAFGGIVMMFR